MPPRWACCLSLKSVVGCSPLPSQEGVGREVAGGVSLQRTRRVRLRAWAVVVSGRMFVLVALVAALVVSVRSASAGASSRAALVGSTPRLPSYRAPRSVGGSSEFGSVYVTDAIGSADFNGDGLPDVVYTTANSGSTSTFAMQFALNRGSGRFVDGGRALFGGAVPRTQGGGRLVIADFNNDGRPDVYYADSGAEAAPRHARPLNRERKARRRDREHPPIP